MSTGPHAMGIPGLTTAGEVKSAMLGVVQRGSYRHVNLIPQVGWMSKTYVGIYRLRFSFAK